MSESEPRNVMIHVRCPKCSKLTGIWMDDFWGKIFRCVWCTAIIADKRDTDRPGAPPPAGEKV